jgi:hypothetical protein
MGTGKKVSCMNPNSGRTMKIDASIYNIFEEAILAALKKNQPMTYGDMMKAVHQQFANNKIVFDKSVEWYGVTVKNDLQSRGLIQVWMEKGRKMHGLVNS